MSKRPIGLVTRGQQRQNKSPKLTKDKPSIQSLEEQIAALEKDLESSESSSGDEDEPLNLNVNAAARNEKEADNSVHIIKDDTGKLISLTSKLLGLSWYLTRPY